MRDFIGSRMKTIAENISAAFGAQCEVDLRKGSKTVMNDPTLASFAAESVKKLFGEEAVKTSLSHALMGSDDFANYAALVPSLYFFLHTNNKEKGIVEANHNSSFDVDEAVLWRGVAALVSIAKDYLCK